MAFWVSLQSAPPAWSYADGSMNGSTISRFDSRAAPVTPAPSSGLTTSSSADVHVIVRGVPSQGDYIVQLTFRNGRNARIQHLGLVDSVPDYDMPINR